MNRTTPEYVSLTRQDAPTSPPCTRCASSATESVVTMRRLTVDAAPWYRCEDCGHVFAVDDDR